MYTAKKTDKPMNEEDANYLKITARIVISGVVSAAVWYAGLLLVFGPAQGILADPAYQSQKFLDVFTTLEPLPRMAVQPVQFYIGFLLVGVAFSFAWHLVGRWMPPGSVLKRGALFGSIAWLLMNPWFEFYLPWNVMHEPLSLVFLEMALWFFVMLLVGIATAYSHHFLESRNL